MIQFGSWILKTCFSILGAKFFLTLNIFAATTWMFLWCIVATKYQKKMIKLIVWKLSLIFGHVACSFSCLRVGHIITSSEPLLFLSSAEYFYWCHLQNRWFSNKYFKGTVIGKWKSVDKWLLTCSKIILKISYSNYLWFCSNLFVKFAIFLKSSLLFNNFYSLFCLQTKLYGSIT